ncbi:MAG: chromate transporter [Treponema sp.]|nr:chromate transporter [Treponema sp.]
MKKYLEVFLTFLKMGCITFGGGYAVVPIVERELVKKKGWVTLDEVMDYYTIAQITPGIIAVNLATFIGDKQKGPLGGFLATVGFILPGISFVMAAAFFIGNFAELPAVQHAFAGIRIAVGALILDTVIKMSKGAFKDNKAVIIFIAVFVISVLPRDMIPAFFRSPVILVLASGLAGLFVYRQKTASPVEENKQ